MKRDFAISAAWSTASSWVEQAVGAAVFLLIARLIGVENYGVAAMAFAFLFLGEYLVRDTITEAIVQRGELEDGRLEATFVILAGFSVVVVLALAAIGKIASFAYNEPMVAPLLMAASPTVLMIAAAGVPTALLRRRLAYRTLAIRSMVGVVAGGGVGLYMAFQGFGAWSLVGQRLTEIGINSVFSFRAAGWLPKRWPRAADWVLVRGLGPRVVVLRSILLVIAQTPTVALGIFADPRAAGLYAFAARLVELVTFLIVKPMRGVAQSVVAEMRRKAAATDQFFLDLTELTALLAFTAFAGLALIAEPVVVLLLGPEWRPAAAILPILSVAGAVAALIGIQEAYLLAIDRLGRFTRTLAMEAAFGILIVAFASRYGPVAAAAAVAARALCFAPMRTLATLAPEHISPARFARTLVPPLLVAATMAVPVALWALGFAGRIPNTLFVATAVALGVCTVAVTLLKLTPDVAARLRTFIQKDASKQAPEKV